MKSMSYKLKTHGISLILSNKNPISSKWVYKTKYKVDDLINLVAKGYKQLKGVNYVDTVFPFTKLTTMCLMICSICHPKLAPSTTWS